MRTSVATQALSLSRHFGRWLFILALLLNLAVAAFAISSVRNSKLHYEQQAEIQTQNLAHAVDQSITNSFGKLEQSMRVVVFELENQLKKGKINSNMPLGILELQKKLLPEAAGFRVIDHEGNLLLQNTPTLNPNANVADRDYFDYLKQHADAGLSISKPLISRFTNEWVMPLAMRFNHPDGSFAGAVVIPVYVSYFDDILSGYQVGSGGAIALRDRDLGIITRFTPTVLAKGAKVGDGEVSSEMREALARDGLKGTLRTMPPVDGIERIYSFRYIPNAQIYVVAGLAEDYYLTRWWHDIWETTAFCLGFLLVTGTLSVLLFRFWKQQLRDTVSLKESHDRMSGLLADLQEREFALAVAQREGRLGTFVTEMHNNYSWSASCELDILLGIDKDYPHDVDGWTNLVHPDERDALATYLLEEVFGKRRVFSREYRIVRPNDGETRWVYGFGKLELDDKGEPVRFRGSIRDITESKWMEERLHLAREAFLHVHEAIVITDVDANILDVNPEFTRVTGYCREEVIGQNPRILQSGRQDAAFYCSMWDALLKEGFWEGEFHNKRKDGRFYSQATRISTVRDEMNGIVRYVAVASDVTDIRASQLHIEYLALHDKLTDLPNRVKLAERLKKAIEKANATGMLLAVCYLDLDGFKSINDLWGHDVGDMVLVEAARRLQASIRPSDTVARLGGDEFVVLLSNSESVDEIAQDLRRILFLLSEPFEINQIKSQLTASIGVAIYPDDIDDADMLIRRADQAMYIAKSLGRNQFHMFDSETDRRLKKTHELGIRIATALQEGEFKLYYQPKVEMLSGKVVGAEALIRWYHPKSGILPPLEFLPVVENTELSIRIGEWVILQALAQMDAWEKQGISLPVSVNISGFHLQRPDFVSRLAAMLDEYPEVSPSWLELEILETVAMDDVDQVSKVINDCARLGVSFSLDDFGTGYSSLTYFRRLPTQLLKIDHSFVRDILTDAEDYALVEGIVKLAHSFNRQVLAEGVETVEHGLPLMKFGCNLAQGYGIAHPMPPADIPYWISNWSIPEAWRQFAESMHARKESSVVEEGVPASL